MVVWSTVKFLKDQYTSVPIPTADLTGRVVIVTGSNTGLGREAALTLSRFNPARIILAVRNVTAGKAAAEQIFSENGEACKPEVWELDLGDLKSVKAFEERVNSTLERLDVFIANAGVSQVSKSMTKDGFETTLQVNNISTALVAVLVTPLLKKTALLPLPAGAQPFKPHLVIVSSELHLLPTSLPGMDEGKIVATMKETFEKGGGRYHNSKVINVMNARTLSRLTEGAGIIVCAVNPGWCHSDLMRGITGVKAALIQVLKNVMCRTQEVGGRTLVFAATSHDIKTGEYSSLCQVEEPSDLVLSEKGAQAADDIWREYEVIWKETVGVDAKEILGRSV